MTNSLETRLMLAEEFKKEYFSIYDLEIIKTLKDKETREDFLSRLPKPFSFSPSYIIEGKEYSIKDASLKPNTALEEIIAASSERHHNKRRIGKASKHLLNRTFLTNLTACTTVNWGNKEISFEGIEMRRYEQIPKIMHAIKVELLLPENAPYWVRVLALTHDTPEDSHRHEALEKQMADKPLYPHEITLLKRVYNLEDESIRKGITKDMYDSLFEKTIEEYLEIIQPSKRYTPKIKEGLMLLTKKAYESYKEYMARIISTTDNNIKYWTTLIKINDRIDNSHFTAPINKDNFQKNGTKILKDALKNIYMLDAGKKVYLTLKKEKAFSETDNIGSLSEKEFEKRIYHLAELTNSNMDRFIQEIDNLYGERSIELEYGGKKYRKRIEEWQGLLEKEIFKYYKRGRFNRYDKIEGNPKYIFRFEGSLALMDNFIENREAIFAGFTEEEQALVQIKYAQIAKVISCLHLSRNPFVEGKLMLQGENTLGDYKRRNSKYKIEGLIEINKG